MRKYNVYKRYFNSIYIKSIRFILQNAGPGPHCTRGLRYRRGRTWLCLLEASYHSRRWAGRADGKSGR